MRKQKTIGLFLEETAQDANAVYVGTLEFAFGDMIMSHMASPNIEALHKMADAIGISRRHFQDDEKHLHPHYDICKSKKKLAIKLGAIEVHDKELINICHPDLFKIFDRDSLDAFNTSVKQKIL